MGKGLGCEGRIICALCNLVMEEGIGLGGLALWGGCGGWTGQGGLRGWKDVAC